MSPPIDDKIRNRIAALLKQAESEAREQTDSGTGEKLSANTGAAFLYAEKARELAKKYHLELSDVASQQVKPLDYVPPIIDVTTIINPLHRANARIRPRMIWFEDLAQVVAGAYYCRAGVDENGNVFLVGLDFDRELAEQVFINLAEVAFRLMPIEMKKTKTGIGIPSFKPTIYNELKEWPGDEIFESSFHAGFREQLAEIYAKNNQNTSSIAADEFITRIPNNYGYSIDRYYGYERIKWPEIEINDICKEIGKRSARFTTKKVAATKESAIANQQALIQQQKVARENIEGTEAILLLDNSGSISADLQKEVVEGANGYANTALEDKKTSVGIVTFSSDVDDFLSPTQNFGMIKESTHKIYSLSQGSTNMLAAFNRAKLSFKSKMTIRKVIVLITDGMPDYGQENQLINLAKELKRQGIEIMAIGTSGADQDFLNKITSAKGFGLLTSNSEFGEGIKKMAGMLNA